MDSYDAVKDLTKQKKKKSVSLDRVSANSWPTCYLKVITLLSSCSGLGHKITEMKDNIRPIWIYSVLWQTGG